MIGKENLYERKKTYSSPVLTLAMILSVLCVPALAEGPEDPAPEAAEEESIPEGNQAEGAWVYEVVQAAMAAPRPWRSRRRSRRGGRR